MRSLENPKFMRLLSILERAQSFVFARERRQEVASRNLGAFYETAWREAASEVGASIESLGHGVFEMQRNGVKTRVLENTTALDDLATHCVVRSKPVIYGLLEKQGLPVPRHLVFEIGEIDKAAEFLAAVGRDCVVKPATDSGGGQGVTTGIRERRQLARASWSASRGGRSVLIEEQIEGDNIRLLYLDGQLLDAVVRKPPTLVADGRQTVAELIKAANEERARQNGSLSHSLITFDMDLRQTLKKQGLSLHSGPVQGTQIRLKTVVNENCGHENRSITGELGAELLEECAQAVRIAGVRLAGVDVITRDPRISLRKSGGVILEVNSPPGYFWHYHKQDGPFPVAVNVLKALLDKPAAPISVTGP